MLLSLKNYWILYSKKGITERAKQLKAELQQSGELERNDERDISLIACNKYLNDGVSHILVGMRKIEYIEKLSSLICK